ncbi:ATP-dependent nuclease [Aeromonas veronii]|uniref:ATP-dependent nuclease n=1 Tax=Aeromonas veronii TaxID=654 RepID=UPI003CFCDC0E
MSHYIEKLSITNYKSCKSLDITLTPYTPLVGYNNAGKSNILSALEWLVKERVLSSEDYNNIDTDIIVEGKICGISEEIILRLSEEHRASLQPYIQDSVAIIKRTQPTGATKKADLLLEIFNFESGEFKNNPRGIWNAIKCLFPEPIKVGAMENASEDAGKAKSTSTIGKLLKEFCSALNEQHSKVVNRNLNAIRRRMSADGERRLDELAEIDKSINDKIENLFPGISLKLHFDVPDFEDIFNAGTVKVYENKLDGRDIASYGHGAQRSVQMALIQHLAEIKQSSDSPTTTLLLIDEPELYLHPFAIEQVREALYQLSLHGYQVIYTTHSAQMITADRAQHTLFVRKSGELGTHIRTPLREALSIAVPDAAAQAGHLFSLSQSTQILFANAVILTEGKTELRLLPSIYQKITNKTLGQHNIALIETGSVDNIGKTMRILHEMDLPSKGIVDLDYVFKGAIHNGHISRDDDALIILNEILKKLQSEKKIEMKGEIPNAKHCAIMAEDPSSHGAINSLHDRLLEKNIWLWKRGAIESHLGLRSKNENEWARFKSCIDNTDIGIKNSCADFNSVDALIKWLR